MSLFDEDGKIRENKLEGLVDNLPGAGLVGDNSGAEASDFDSSLDESLVSNIGFIAAGQTAANTLGNSGTTAAQGSTAPAGAAAIAGGSTFALEDDIAEEGAPASADNTDAPDDYTGAGREKGGMDPTDRLAD
ncbi:MAG TPA: hypothetical protein VF952_08470 [Chloroflexia bacterium]|jgi:hypothetical protein